MAQKARLSSEYGGPYYDEQTVESLDEPAGGPELMAYGSTPSMAKRDYFLPEDIPLFLSNEAAEPGPRGFGNGGTDGFDRKAISSRIFKAGLLLASAAAIAVAIASVENPLALFANAKASLIGVPSNVRPKSALEPVVVAQLATAPPEPAAPSGIGMAALPPAATPAPTRDEIASALRAAHHSQPEIRQPSPSVAAPPPARRLDADELAALLKRARSLIAIGDIAPARLLLERAADAQVASAALLLAQTWDPAVLGTPDSRSITPDPAKARDWYRKAAQFGSQDAQLRLSQLQN